MRPRDYSEALYVGQYFREGIPVVMDLTAVADEEAKQFVDFAAGLICGRRGDMERLSPKVFLLLPSGLAKSNAAAMKVEATASESS
ncbi:MULTISPECIES: cell division protein SepF [Streptosporangium]|uniref:FtsZ-interacting cell division protein YlmF n=1 Tax=Streptosporangium brasiliense TaxID=47480 RepID=A0ABT9R2B3_9ACTN|nr:cell division protein SepF [Streptosporangium brasiliense]MDP9863357.1 FtsZ-interacting cell division protein YlmF [Streptosporangium brasiliense]